MAGMGSMTECSDPSVQNKMAVTECSALRVGDDGKLYCLCEPGRRTMCEECAKAVARVIGDKNKRLNKMEGMESMTDCSSPILDPSVNHGVEDGKLCCLCMPDCEECAEAAQSHRKLKGENNLMLSKIQIRSHLNKMVGMVEKFGKLYYMCKKCGVLAGAQSHLEQQDENSLICSKIQIQSHLNKMAVMEYLPDWSGLLTELLVEIAIKLSVIEDFTAFRGVCTSWRAAATKDKFVSVSKVPLLMLAEKDGDGDVREFYSLCKSKIFTRMPVPESKGKRCIGAGFGWILTVATSGSGELSLAKPMSSSKINLPNMKTFPEYEKYQTRPEHIFIGGQAVLSANPSETSDFVLMVFVIMNVGFWRSGDNHWTRIEIQGAFANIGFYKHKLYVIDHKASIWIWDPNLTQEPKMLLTLHQEDWWGCMELAYLVESSKGELLLIMRTSLYCSEPEDYYSYFGVFRIDTVNKEYTEIDTLDQDAIFIGQNCGAVSAVDYPGVIKANCIYFTDDNCQDWLAVDGQAWKPLPGTEMGIYHVEDANIERFDVESFSSICPPFWVFPSLC